RLRSTLNCFVRFGSRLSEEGELYAPTSTLSTTSSAYFYPICQSTVLISFIFTALAPVIGLHSVI
ncbi:hypothetical protein, partial [Snodgrassella sp. CS2]|uniref:hypothetical protein n=1 Tax=Snodgrassella sp. CS2 TaxID=3418953 RepID=UPI003CFC5ACE